MNKFDPKLYQWARYDSDRGTKLTDPKGRSVIVKKGDLVGVYELNSKTDYILVEKFPAVVFRNPPIQTDKLFDKCKAYKGKPPKLDNNADSAATAAKKNKVQIKLNVKPVEVAYQQTIKMPVKPIKVQIVKKPVKHQDQEEFLDEKTQAQPDLWQSRKIVDPDELDYDDEIPSNIYHSYRNSMSNDNAARKPIVRKKRKVFDDSL